MITTNPLVTLFGTTASKMEQLDADSDPCVFEGGLWADVVSFESYKFAFQYDDTDSIRADAAKFDAISQYGPDLWSMGLQLFDAEGNPYERDIDRVTFPDPHTEVHSGYYELFISATHPHVMLPSASCYLPDRDDIQHLRSLIDAGIAEPLSAVQCSSLSLAISGLTIQHARQ